MFDNQNKLISHTRVKICGITHPQDALLAAKLGADAIGLVFYKKSPRAVSVIQAQSIIQALPPFVTVVGLTAQEIPPIQIEEIKLIGDSKIINDYLTIKLKTDLQQIQIDTDHYGQSYGDIEIHHWHMPTLNQIKKTWEEIRHQDFSPSQQANVAKFRLMPLALTFLNKSPELALTNLNVKTPQGELRGGLQIKMKPLKGGIFAFLNPSSFINALNAQLELHIPQSLLDILIEDENIDNTIRQRLKTWKEKGILKRNDAAPGYYYSQIQLSEGILQVNGEQKPIATILF